MTTKTFHIIIQEGEGSVNVSVNGSLFGTATKALGVDVTVLTSDVLKLAAIPAQGYSFSKYCISLLCSAIIEANPFINNTVYANLPDTTYYTYFTANALCGWISGKGGKAALGVPEIMELSDAYLGFRNLGFTPSIQEIMGCQDYYLGFVQSGDEKTGC
ncbi:MAG: hypothetical protein PHH85_02130 [Candidatus Methanoperedens sp.]|nr:hypothetical protein [Candidatus Methanoperedens sp.]